MLNKSYFIRSTNYDTQGKEIASSWSVRERGWFTRPAYLINEYRHEKENELGGICMVTEFRRIK